MCPQLTVGIPIFNGMPHLRQAIESVLGQTLSDFEVLAIDDGSEDDTLDYLSSLTDPRLRIVTQPNRGVTTTLNRLLTEANSPWLVRLDADDLASPDRLHIVTDFIRRFPQAGMFYSRAQHLGHDSSIALTRCTEATPVEIRRITTEGYLLAVCHSTVVLNIQKALDLGGYRFDYLVEDRDLWWRMALAHEIVFIPEVTAQYRLHESSVCAQNIAEVWTNTLYAQYLLLSHLWGLTPSDHDYVFPSLERLLSQKSIPYRLAMYRAAISLGERNYIPAVRNVVAAAIHSPVRTFRRCIYPFHHSEQVKVGERPGLFKRYSEHLWPSDCSRLIA